MITSQKVGGIGELTKFEFQYLPRIGMMTELGDYEKDSAPNAQTPPRNGQRPFWAVLLIGVVGAVAVGKYLGVGMDYGSLSSLRSVPRRALSMAMTHFEMVSGFGS